MGSPALERDKYRKPSEAMSLDQVANRTSYNALRSTRLWAYGDKPLHLPGVNPIESRISRPGIGEVVRFAGIVTDVDIESEHGIMYPYGEGIGTDATKMQFNLNLGGYAGKIAVLRGLIMDVDMRIDGWSEEGPDREGSILAVHGIEQQVRRGDGTGLLRGEVAYVGQVDGFIVTEIVSGEGHLLRVHESPASDDNIFRPDNVVALRVYGGTSSGDFTHDLHPAHPMQPSTLLLDSSTAAAA